MDVLKVGFSRVNANPPMGIEIAGYYKVRRAEAILDDIEINAVAFEFGKKKAVILSLDHCGIKKELAEEFRKRVSKATGIALNGVFVCATHSHTAPCMRPDTTDKIELDYIEFVATRFADAAVFAVDDLKPAKMGWGIGKAPNVAFVRRFRMKDGSIKTNPGVNNPDIVEPVGEIDDRVNVIRFDRDGADTVVIVNFGNHPDVVGGNKISADWPGLLRKNVETILDGTKCIFFNGAQGDLNHVNVFPKEGDLNGMFMDFDDVSRGYPHAMYIARVVTGGVLQAYDKVKYIDVDSINYEVKDIKVASNRATAEEIVKAKELNALHMAGKDDEIPFKGMMLTTVVAEAQRMIRLENGPDFFTMPLSCLTVGPVAFLGIPGEPFMQIGKGIKETEGFELILPMCLTNGSQGYFPMYDAYAEGGYEARSSSFKAGVAEFIIDESKKLLKEVLEK